MGVSARKISPTLMPAPCSIPTSPTATHRGPRADVTDGDREGLRAPMLRREQRSGARRTRDRKKQLLFTRSGEGECWREGEGEADGGCGEVADRGEVG